MCRCMYVTVYVKTPATPRKVDPKDPSLRAAGVEKAAARPPMSDVPGLYFNITLYSNYSIKYHMLYYITLYHMTVLY